VSDSIRLLAGSRAGRLTALLACVLIALAAAGAGPADAAKKKRYVALTPFAANTLVKLGIKPVAIGETPGGQTSLSPKLKNVPELPLSHASNGPNLEQLVSYDPDVVFSEQTWKAGHGAIRNLGIRVYMDDPNEVQNVPGSIKKVGAHAKQKKRAEKVAKKAQKQIKTATRNVGDGPRVLVILGVGQTPYAFMPNSWGGNVVMRSGGALITGGLDSEDPGIPGGGGYAQISDEQIIAENPDYIIAVPHGNAEDIPEIQESLENDTAFANTNAGRNDEIHVTTRNDLVQATTDVPKTIKFVRSLLDN
jgi:iron complex transport system substrate-binding protein